MSSDGYYEFHINLTEHGEMIVEIAHNAINDALDAINAVCKDKHLNSFDTDIVSQLIIYGIREALKPTAPLPMELTDLFNKRDAI